MNSNVTPLMFSTYSLTLLASLETNILSVSFVYRILSMQK